jgi:hypothetical protein
LARKAMSTYVAEQIIKHNKLTINTLKHKPDKVDRAIEAHLARCSPETIMNIVMSSKTPIDVNGFEFANGRKLLRAAASLVITKAVEYKLKERAVRIPQQRRAKSRPKPKMRVARQHVLVST